MIYYFVTYLKYSHNLCKWNYYYNFYISLKYKGDSLFLKIMKIFQIISIIYTNTNDFIIFLLNIVCFILNSYNVSIKWNSLYKWLYNNKNIWEIIYKI